LVTKAATVQSGESESEQLFIALRDFATAKDMAIKLINVPPIQIGMIREDFKKRGVSPQVHGVAPG
jgi:hypothetical protein